MNHEIQLQMGDLERAPGGPANVIGHSSAAVTPGATSDLEDPPGLYEKVGGQFEPVVAARFCDDCHNNYVGTILRY